MHVVAPKPGWYSPASQALHEPNPVLEARVPGEQSVWSSEVEPAAQEEPAGQGLQAPSDAAFTVSLHVPNGHRIGADAPSSQYVPAEQPMQAVAPWLLWYSPPEQAAHAV
jgi:hypothetical protein